MTVVNADDFLDSNNYIPSWAKGATEDKILEKCESGDYDEQTADWCLEFLKEMLTALNDNPIIQSTAPDIQTKSFKCSEGEEWIESAGICMTQEPTPEPQPACGQGTELVDGICKVIKTEEGGGCLIATATYGSELAPQVQLLREIRDNSLLQTASGTSFMTGFNQFYYSFSPTIADWERENPIFKEAVKITLTPMITSLSILNYVDMDSEVSVVGYGISLIILNVGMYFVAPAVMIIGIKKYSNY